MFATSYTTAVLLAAVPILAVPQQRQQQSRLSPCGDAFFDPANYTCYDGDFLCPVRDGTPTLRCGPDCYSADTYSCSDGRLIYPPASTWTSTSTAATGTACAGTPPTTQWLRDPPYDNYFYSDCESATQVVVTSPLADSDLTVIGPRIVVAWPAGSSGLVVYLQPRNGVNGSLAIALSNGTADFPLRAAYAAPAADSRSGLPFVGVSTLVQLNDSAVLTVPILGSVRNVRDFTESGSILSPAIQDGVRYAELADGGGVELSRLWLDNVTTTRVSFRPVGNGSLALGTSAEGNQTVNFDVGTYNFTATFDYPQLTQLNASALLNQESQGLITQDPDETTSLTFLSYSEKLVAGAWRFLTYFGRDSMIAALLLQPVLSQGEGGAVEAVIGAVLERINRTSGILCHEETIGDYATYLHLMDNVTSTAPGCTYQMVDTDYYLPPLMVNYFLETETGQGRVDDFFASNATLDFGNAGMRYAALALINAETIMSNAESFAQPGGQVQENLIRLQEDQTVGEWRDSNKGIGGGRIPYDVNTGLMPAALRSISSLSAAGFYPEHPDWARTAADYAQIWEDSTLQFFEVSVRLHDARTLVDNYTASAGMGFPSHADDIADDVLFYGIALNGSNDQPLVRTMHTDDCFRLFLSNATGSSFLNQTATNIRAPFPVGLSTPVGVLIANPAFGGDPAYAANWTNNVYHGTVVWGWPMAMLAAGLERQLHRCLATAADPSPPPFCADDVVHANVLGAYNHLWDLIEANAAYINNEVWSWQYRDGDFHFTPLGALPPPEGQPPTESNIRQLWSLTWLAVKRDRSLM